MYMCNVVYYPFINNKIISKITYLHVHCTKHKYKQLGGLELPNQDGSSDGPDQGHIQ